MNTVKVRAITLGFDGFQRRKPGEEFNIDERHVFDKDGKFKSNWLELVDKKRIPTKQQKSTQNPQRKPETGELKASDPRAHVPPQGDDGGDSEGDGAVGSGNQDVI